MVNESMITHESLRTCFALSVLFLGASTVALPQPKSTTVLRAPDFHTLGDGQTDDTAALQKAIDTAIATHATLEFPPGPGGGCYASGSLTIRDASNVTLRGTGGVLCWKGGKKGARIGLGYAGNLSDVTIEGLEITGAGPDEMYHAGIVAPSGANLKNIVIRKNYVHDVSIGISLNADLGGTLDGFLIAENRVEDVIGTIAGYGYGIHDANGSGKLSNGRIVANTLIDCQRNSIYQAKGSGIFIANNTILNHGGNRPRQSSPFTGIQVARGSDIVVTGNVVEGASDGSIYVGTDRKVPMHDITIIGNKFIDPRGALPVMTIGSPDPATDGYPEQVAVVGNTFVVKGARILSVQINSGKQINIVGNSFQILRSPGFAAAVQIRGQGETFGSALYTDDLNISHNEIAISTAGSGGVAFDVIPRASASSISARFAGNIINAPSGPFLLEGSSKRRMVNEPVPDAHIHKQVALNASAPSVVPGCFQLPVRFSGAAPGDTVRFGSASSLATNLYLSGIVATPGQVTVKWCQLFGPPSDPDGPEGGNYFIDVWKH
ncbi:MAG TPA: right-handed parallel beta-helix repeat-containing protein [Terracidiphilus sp.]|jgi:hypothetical protein